MGYNDLGQLGDGTVTSRHVPEEILPLVNNDFETGDFNGWTTSGNFTLSFVSTNSANVHSGRYGARMGPSGSLAFLSQTMATTAGTRYLISFWLNCDGLTANE